MSPTGDQNLSSSLCGLDGIVAAINELELELLDREWVQRMWSDSFSDCPSDLPDAYAERFDLGDSDERIAVIEQIKNAIKSWLGTETPGNGWEALKDLDHKKLLALLFFYVKNASTRSNDVGAIFLGIKAVDLYLHLLLIPGSKVYNIFHMNIYDACLDTFLLYKVLDSNEELTVPQAVAIQTGLNNLLISFKEFVGKFSLKNEEALKSTLRSLADVTRAERKFKIEGSGLVRDKASCLMYTKTAFEVMKSLCDEVHGRPCETSRLAFVRIFPNLSLIGGNAIPDMVQWTVQEQAVVRANTLWFIQTCVASLGQPVLENIKILIQHLIRSMPNRADVRPKYIDIVITLISLLPETPYFDTLLWICRDAFSNSVSQRVVALELLSKLIYLKQGGMEQSNVTQSSHSNSESSGSLNGQEVQNDRDSEVSVTNAQVISFSKPIQYLPIEYRRAMLAIIIDRIRDSSATIGAKALGILSGLIANKTSPTVTKLVNGVFLDPYKEDYDQPPEKNGFVDFKIFTAALTNGNFTEKATNLIPDGIAVVKLLQEQFLVSPRYSTRRAAIQLMLQLFQLNPYWMSSPLLIAFSHHCRDPSKQLRKETIKLFTELLLFYPTHSQILELWVTEVVPAVDDVEDSVVEEALRVLKVNILDKISSTSTDPLPWSILSQIARQKMRTFLKIACQKWQRKNDVNSSRINAILSHIGSEHNSAAWILLASLSEFVDIANPQPILDYYMRDVVGSDNAEVPNLVVITLHNTWRQLKKEQQDMLQTQLFQHVKECKIPTKLLAISVDIATAMAVSRSDDKVQAKKEIAKWTKETVLESEKHVSDCLGSSLAAMEECEFCAYYMTLIGCLTELHPDGICVNTFDLLFQFLTTAKVLPRSKLCKLKAVAVLTLARMAFLDNVIASRLILGLSPFLNNKTDPVLLNNVIVSIADIGERFPNLIEPLVPYLSLCLKNYFRNIRELTLVVIIDLLKEDYLRARSAIVYHLLSLLNDKSERTVAIVKSYFTKAADKKKLNVDDILIRCMFQYNKYKNHSFYKLEQLSKNEEMAFSMSGDDKFTHRTTIYRFLMKIVSVTDRLGNCEHLAQVVLNGISEGLIQIDTPEGQGLLKDTFAILLSPEMQFDDVTKNKDDREEDGEHEDARTVAAKVLTAELYQTKLLPIIVSLCAKLKKPLSKDRKLTILLYAFLRELLRDCKTDLSDLFREDRVFGQEIAHEIKTKPRSTNGILVLPREEEPYQPNPPPVEAEVRQDIESTGQQHKRKSGEHANTSASKKAKTNDETMNELSREVSEVSLKKSPAKERKSLRRSQRSVSAQDRVDTTARRSTRSVSLYSGDTEANEMPPPSKPPSRLSKRRPATPSAVPGAPPLFSSTPLLASHAEIEAVDISPVVNEKEQTTV